MEKIFLFDIGNIFITHYDAKKLYDNMKCTCTYEKFFHYFRESDYFYESEKGLISTHEFVQKLNRDTGSNVTTEEFIKYHIEAKGKICDNALKLINELKEKGYKVGILSNLKKIDVTHFQTVLDKNMLDYEFYSCYLGDMKPSIKLFNHVREMTNADANEVYFFDDLEENCEVARNAHIRAICTRGETILEDFKKYVNLEGDN